jgi:hypothetical protein
MRDRCDGCNEKFEGDNDIGFLVTLPVTKRQICDLCTQFLVASITKAHAGNHKLEPHEGE